MTPNEEGALKWATGYFRRYARELTPQGRRNRSVAIIVERLIELREGGAHIGLLVDDIKEDMPPDVVREFAITLLQRGERLPKTVLDYVVDSLRNPRLAKQRGRDSYKLAHPNIVIALAMAEIVQRWGISATRNDATERACAASLVRDALKRGANIHLTEATVNRAWKQGRLSELS